MNTKQIIAAAFVTLAAGSAFAADTTGNFFDFNAGTATRDEVAADLAVYKAGAATRIKPNEFPTNYVSPTALTRAEVVADLRTSGSVSIASNEFFDNPAATQVARSTVRGEVLTSASK